MNEVEILQSLAVDARKRAKEELKIDSLHEIKSLKKDQLTKFQMRTTQIVYNKITNETSLQPKVIKMIINTDSYSYCIVINGYIVDCAIDYYIPTKTFASKISDYPIKVKDIQYVTEHFITLDQPKDLNESQ